MVTRIFAFRRVISGRLSFCSEEGNQAAAKRTFGFTRAYNEKIKELRSSGKRASVWIFEWKRKETMRREAAYGFTRAYNEKIKELRSSGKRGAFGFSSGRGRKPSGREAAYGFTRAYNEKIKELRSSGKRASVWIFEWKRKETMKTVSKRKRPRKEFTAAYLADENPFQ